MHDMKFKWKLVAVFTTVFACALWFLCIHHNIGLEENLPTIKLTSEEEIASLKHQLRMILDFRVMSADPSIPTIYAITPTFSRPVQKAELTRLSQSFRLVPNFHWIIVEDSPTKTPLVANFLRNSLLNYTHLNAETPPKWKFVNNKPTWKKPRGVLQRNTALTWLRENKTPGDKGVIYFADDDNSYNVQIFEEMRYTRTVSVWPVGLVGGLMVEKCLIDSATGRVAGWNSAWKPDRPFPLDMAAFAINLQLLLSHPHAMFSFDIERGLQETAILRHLVKREEMEPRAANCTKVYVWHTRTEEPILKDELRLKKLGKENSNKDIEV